MDVEEIIIKVIWHFKGMTGWAKTGDVNKMQDLFFLSFENSPEVFCL